VRRRHFPSLQESPHGEYNPRRSSVTEASSVLRASPPSHTARPASRELPVDPHCDHRWDFSCCVWSPLLACRRQYPGRSDGTCSLVPFHHLRPSHEPGRVGSCIVGFGACSAFTHVTACTLAKSPCDSLHQRLQQFRCLQCCSDCYRVERTSSRAGYSRCGPPPFTTHPVSRQIIQVELRRARTRRAPTQVRLRVHNPNLQRQGSEVFSRPRARRSSRPDRAPELGGPHHRLLSNQ
jgi:hypothetical protein